MGSGTSRPSDPAVPSTLHAPPRSNGLFQAENSENVGNANTNPLCLDSYDALHKEASHILLPEFFDGLNIVVENRVHKRFAITPISVQEAHGNKFNEFLSSVSGVSAVFKHQKLHLNGLMDSEGARIALVKYNFTNNFSSSIISKLRNEDKVAPETTQFRFDYEGKGYRSQFSLKPKVYCGVEHKQIVDSNLLLGTHLYRRENGSFGIDYSAQYCTNNNMLAIVEVLDDGSFSLSCIHKLSEKISLASELRRPPTEYAISSGFLYKFNEYLLRGKANLNGEISAYLERKIGSGSRLLLSAKFDLLKKDYKFGYCLEFDMPLCTLSRPVPTSIVPRSEGVLVSL